MAGTLSLAGLPSQRVTEPTAPEVVGAGHKTFRDDSGNSGAVADQPHRDGHDGKCVDLWAEHGDERRPWPECEQELSDRDHAEERMWRHVDTCRSQTFLNARVPRALSAHA